MVKEIARFFLVWFVFFFLEIQPEIGVVYIFKYTLKYFKKFLFNYSISSSGMIFKLFKGNAFKTF